jgi:putative thioredoxin
VDVTDANFYNDVLMRSHSEPVVVDFWADWCGPCKSLAPVLEQACDERGVTLAKLDVDANQQVALEYDIRGIPAVKAFRNGHVVAEFVGAQPPTRVAAFLDELTKPPVAETLTDDPEIANALAAGDYKRALETLLGRLEAVGNADERGEIRDLMVRIFLELGQEHPLASSYRRRLAAALY